MIAVRSAHAGPADQDPPEDQEHGAERGVAPAHPGVVRRVPEPRAGDHRGADHDAERDDAPGEPGQVLRPPERGPIVSLSTRPRLPPRGRRSRGPGALRAVWRRPTGRPSLPSTGQVAASRPPARRAVGPGYPAVSIHPTVSYPGFAPIAGARDVAVELEPLVGALAHEVEPADLELGSGPAPSAGSPGSRPLRCPRPARYRRPTSGPRRWPSTSRRPPRRAAGSPT